VIATALRKAVIDTVVNLQAALNPAGPAFAVLELADAGRLGLVASDETLEEVAEVLSRPKLRAKYPNLKDERRDQLLAVIRHVIDVKCGCLTISLNASLLAGRTGRRDVKSWHYPSVGAMDLQMAACLQLDQAEDFGAFDVAVVLGALGLGEYSLVGAIGKLLDSRLQGGVDSQRHDSRCRLGVQAITEGVKHQVKGVDCGRGFHDAEFIGYGGQSQAAGGAYAAAPVWIV